MTAAERQAAQDALNDLKEILRTGARSAVIDGESVTFRSETEIQRTIRGLETDLGIRRKRSRVLRVYMGHR